MSRPDPGLEHEFSSAGGLDRSQVTPAPSERDGTLNRRQSDKAGPAAPAAMGKAAPRRVVLVESDQYYRETLTGELLRQGFIVHAFTDGASLLGSLAIAADADLAVLDWDLPKMSGIKLLAELRRQGVNLPVVFLTGKVHRRRRARPMPARPAGGPECLRMHGVRPGRRRLHLQVPRQAGPRQAAEERGRTRQAQGQRCASRRRWRATSSC